MRLRDKKGQSYFRNSFRMRKRSWDSAEQSATKRIVCGILAESNPSYLRLVVHRELRAVQVHLTELLPGKRDARDTVADVHRGGRGGGGDHFWGRVCGGDARGIVLS